MIDFDCGNSYGYRDLLSIMARLRAPDGCPWDQVQTHASIRRNLVEETCEVLDALDRDHPQDLCEELGDVLLQVVFHAQIESERGRFTMDDVIDRLCRKLIFRHPHVFGDADAHGSTEQALANWEARKRQEHGQTSAADAIDAVPRTLPALWRAEKIHGKAAKAGFDWASPAEALDKLQEEVSELKQALAAGLPVDAPHSIREELGDVIVAAVKVGQMCGLDPEDAVHRACDKYAVRYRRVESAAARPLSTCSDQELSILWQQAKTDDSLKEDSHEQSRSDQ